jgi:transposase
MVHARRVIVNAIVYINRTGCPAGTLPNDFPPCCTTGDATRPGPPPAATPARPRA